jgi:large subunit ribosomal protein L16
MAKGGTELLNGTFGIQALEAGWITSRQIETIRRVVVRHMRRRGKIWIRIFPDKPVTAKPAETRMGKGKGSVDHWVAVVKPGRILLEIDGVPEDMAREALRLSGYKLPIRTQVVSREDTF